MPHDDRFTRMVRVATELQAADDLPSLTHAVVSHLADAVGAVAATLIERVDDHTLAMVGLRGGTPGSASRWATFPSDLTTPAGAAALSGEPQLISGLGEIERRYPTVEMGTRQERTLLCLPLVVGGRTLGVTTLAFPGRLEEEELPLDLLTMLADTTAQSLARIQVTETARDQDERLRFLAEASAELARHLDYETTLRNVVWLAVPGVADWCSIQLEQDGVLRTLAVAHRDPAKLALAAEYERRYPPDPALDAGAYAVLRTGESLLIPEITEEMLVSGAQDEQHIQMIRELQLHSVLTVPLRVQDRILGVITWVNGESQRRFSPADVAFGEDFGRRAGTAIDNAELHSELRTIADRLQQAVRPAPLPRLDGWRLAACYRSAGHADVGGDFYEVIPLGGGRLAVVLGDVMGRGVEAAAAMSELRSALRALVAVDPDPEAVTSRLDLLYDRFPSDQLVTLVYAVADPDRDSLRLVNAGHLPPLVLAPDGSGTFLDQTGGRLIGAGPSDRPATEITLPAGHTLLLFTDGLLERRGEDVEEGRDRLLTALSGHRGLGEEELGVLVEGMRDRTRDDDVAVLAVTRCDRDFPVR